jgi:hypothetical protein
MKLVVPCPRCPAGMVVLERAEWADPGAPTGRRDSTWVEEPLACSRGCSVPAVQVLGTPTRPKRAPPKATQLPLWTEGA